MSKKLEYSYEEKLKAVLLVVKDYRSIQSVAEKIGASKQGVRRWVELYKQFGKDGLIIKNGSYSIEFKLSVLRHMEKNKLSYFKTAVIFGIPCDSVLQKWKRKYDEIGEMGFIQENLHRKEYMNFEKSNLKEKTKEELEKEVFYLQAEVDCLKKLQALVQKKEALEKERKQRLSKN